MTEADKPALFKLIGDVMAFYRQDVSQFALSVWWQVCQRFDLAQVRRALTAHAMDAERGQFAPKPADLVRQLEGTATDRAMLAWSKVLDAAQRAGAYIDVVFDDPAIHAVVEDLGGWVKVCRGETKDLSYLQHRFCESHRAYTGRGEFVFPRMLCGDRSPDSEFHRRGLQPPKPALIGDKAKARRVYECGSVRVGAQIGGPVFDALAHSAKLIVSDREAA
jgi:hypothetical protein